MKKRIPLLILVFFACCASKKKIDYGKYIPLKDLMIPLLYNNDVDIMMPIVFNKQFTGRVSLQVKTTDMNEQSVWLDSTFYDQVNKTMLHKSNGSNKADKIVYNSLGLIVSGDSYNDQPDHIDYTYSYDSTNLTIHCFMTQNGSQLPNDLSFEFDASGYLYKIANHAPERSFDCIFLYDSEKKLKQESTTFKSTEDSALVARDWVPGSYSIPHHIVCDYYYGHSKLDSVINNTYFYGRKDPVKEITYVDSIGLPIKKIWSRSATSARTITYYQYHH